MVQGNIILCILKLPLELETIIPENDSVLLLQD